MNTFVCPRCRAKLPSSERDAHLQAHRNAEKPSSSARGYGEEHRRLREQWAPLVAQGTVTCARHSLGQCQLADRPEGPLILPGERWQLDHVDGDKTRYLGPSHSECNQATAGRRR